MELTIEIPPRIDRLAVAGPSERNLKLVREALGVTIAGRDSSLRLYGEGESVDRAASVLEKLIEAAGKRRPLDRAQLLDLLAQADHGDVSGPIGSPLPSSSLTQGMEVYLPGRRVRAMTPGQKAYLQSIEQHDLTFCVGPAGTGKTYLAVAAAVTLLRQQRVRKLVLVRPAVEAGERLGFLPGTMQDKVNPYLRPLLDALHDMMGFEQIQKFMACDLIEIVPLAFMRGRTLNDALIILDEAQNATRTQMLMFLTRLGHGGKMIVTGDASQTDLDDPADSGLIDAVHRLRYTRGVGMVALEQQDIVRHSLVQQIVQAYGGESRKNPISKILRQDAPAKEVTPQTETGSGKNNDSDADSR